MPARFCYITVVGVEMTENKLPIRKSPRLEGYNYAQEGAYFITICVQNRLRLFGTVEEQELYLNDAGKMVSRLVAENS